ncbi:MAG: hypothetical protein IJB79_03540 [Candidatus Gastranaerophilales bacterium]|nr:hypothetical protein [Candidatus Gastranaerophilales bacterium]
MIYDVLPVNNYQGNDSSTIFDFDFYIDDSSQLKVFLYDENGLKYQLENEVDYLIDGIKNKNGGSINFPIEGSKYSKLKSDQKISLELDIPVSQETQYNNSSLLNLETLEYSFDYLTRLVQILKRKIDLCVKVDECSNNTPQELIDMINDANLNANLQAQAALESKNIAKNAATLANDCLNLAKEYSNDVQNIKEELSQSGMYKFNLFDTKISDSFLTGAQSKGWALQGTYVTKALYPDFYNVCLEQKNSSTQTQITFDNSIITMFVHDNGHQFFEIKDKSVIDSLYNTYGIADFYGIDEESERIFLPRNKWFAIKNPSSSVPVVGNGLNVGFKVGDAAFGLGKSAVGAGVGTLIGVATELYGGAEGQDLHGAINKTEYLQGLGLTSDSSKSGIIAKTSNVIQPDTNKYLYYCVGNTIVDDSKINAGALVSQMELKANSSLDNINSSAMALICNSIMSSGKYIDFEIGANATNYYAPACGYFALNLQGTGIRISNSKGLLSGVNSALQTFIPCAKGEFVTLRYDTITVPTTFRFYYMNGTESEAN